MREETLLYNPTYSKKIIRKDKAYPYANKSDNLDGKDKSLERHKVANLT